MRKFFLFELWFALFSSNNSFACVTPETAKAAAEPFVATSAKPTSELYKQIMAQMHSKMDKVKTSSTSKDKEFLELMIPHHEAAVQMAQVVLLHTQDEKVKNLALSIIADQQNEIEFMKLNLKGESK